MMLQKVPSASPQAACSASPPRGWHGPGPIKQLRHHRRSMTTSKVKIAAL